MPTLNVRNVPEKLYRMLSDSARSDRRSVSCQTIVLLEDALARRAASHVAMTTVLARIRKRRARVRLPEGWEGTLELLRQDRSR